MSEPVFVRDIDLSNMPEADLRAIGRWLEIQGQHTFPRFTAWLHASLVAEMERRRKSAFDPPAPLPDFRYAHNDVVGEILVATHLLSYAEGLSEKTAVEFIDSLAHNAATLAAARLGFITPDLTPPPESVN